MAKFLIVEARFYDHLNDMLVSGAKAALKAKGHEVEVITVPGALEIPGTIAMAAEAQMYDGFVAIGVVIRGETYHFEIVAGESARGDGGVPQGGPGRHAEARDERSRPGRPASRRPGRPSGPGPAG